MTTQVAEAPGRAALDVIYRRRAVRRYAPDALDGATVHLLLDAAVHAPTAMHGEPWQFVVIQDPEKLERLSRRAKALIAEHLTADRELLRAPGASPNGEHFKRLMDPSFNIFYDAGTLIVVCAKPLNGFVTADCWLAAENLMLAACALGLGTCCIGLALPALRASDVKRELGIPAGSEAVAAIIVGKAEGEPPVVPRKPPEILSWIRSPGR